MKLFIAKRSVITGIINFKLFFGVPLVIVEIDYELWSQAGLGSDTAFVIE